MIIILNQELQEEILDHLDDGNYKNIFEYHF